MLVYNSVEITEVYQLYGDNDRGASYKLCS